MDYHLTLMVKVGHEMPDISLKVAKLKYLSEVGYSGSFKNIFSIVQVQVDSDFYYGIDVGKFSSALIGFFKFDLEEIKSDFWLVKKSAESVYSSNDNGFINFIAYLISKFEHGNFSETVKFVKNSVAFYLLYSWR